MKKEIMLLISIVLSLSVVLFPAIYQGKKLDEKHYTAEIQKEDSPNIYKVDVVFVGRAANLCFAVNQVLPVEANDNVLMTLYLEKAEIEDPEKIKLKQVKPPPIIDDSKPEDWEATDFWYLKLDKNSLK